jgi:anti-sigma factor ChrR (cupin superfamily)
MSAEPLGSSLFLDSRELPWRDSPYPGVQWKKLRFDADSGASAVLLRFEPGASYGAHRHPAGEEYLVLEGSLEDAGRTYGVGCYVHHPPGSAHKPSSRQGCLVFVILPRPIEDLEG